MLDVVEYQLWGGGAADDCQVLGVEGQFDSCDFQRADVLDVEGFLFLLELEGECGVFTIIDQDYELSLGTGCEGLIGSALRMA